MSRDRAFCPPLLLVLALLVACGDAQSSDAMSTMSAAEGGMTPSAAGSSGSKGSAETTTGAAGSAAPSSAQPVQRTAAAAGSSAPNSASAGAASTPQTGTVLTPLGPGTCCPDGKCLCRAEPPGSLVADKGPHTVMQYEIAGVGCVFYPSDAPPPYAAVAFADGFGGSGGCDSVQTEQWGPLYASHGLVAMLVETGTGDQPNARGEALISAIATFKAEHAKSESPLFGKLAGRYGTSGFSMGGGGSTFAAHSDMTLLSSVAIMPWGASKEAGNVPTLIVCGDDDGVAPCSEHGSSAYASIDSKVPKMRVTVTSAHNGEPSAASGATGAYALAFQKLFLEGDERWRSLLVGAKSDESTIK